MKKLIERIKKKENVDSYVENPNNMLLELTNACNHKCLFCSHRKMKRPVRHMDLAFAKRIIDEGYEMGIRELGLYMMGESFLYKDLGVVIQYAKQIGYEYVYITTNGVLASKEKVIEIFSAGVDSIKFSINAVEKEKYELIHGKDEIEAVIENLKWIYDYKKQNKSEVNIFVSSILTKYNCDEKMIRSVLEPFCDELVTYEMINHEGLVPEVEAYLRDSENNSGIGITCKAPCPRIFNCVHVTVEGYLTACCMDVNNYLAYADLNKTDLKTAWNNDVITEFRNKHLNNAVEGSLCFNCIYGIKGQINPLVKEYATEITEKEILNSEEIVTRLEKYKSKIDKE